MDDAKVHILTHTLHYGNGVFEGTRAYMTKDGLAIFKLREHTKRLLNSAKITRINATYSLEELEAAHIELLPVLEQFFPETVSGLTLPAFTEGFTPQISEYKPAVLIKTAREHIAARGDYSSFP